VNRFLVSMLGVFAAVPAFAQQANDSVVIDSPAAPTQGRIGVNLAAGGNNQQANVAVVAIGGTALASGAVIQTMGQRSPELAGTRQSFIAGQSFAGSSGVTEVNVASGSDNQQANLAVIGIGLEGFVMTDAMLSQTRASEEPGGGQEVADAHDYAVGVAPGAFAGSSGLVQVSLIGGERNTSANVFTLTTVGVSP